MIPTPIRQATSCELVDRWLISLELAQKLKAVAARLEQRLSFVLISGYRTCLEQQALAAAGRPAASCDRSTHTSCPSTGADIWIEGGRSGSLIDVIDLGLAAEREGLRWGGGSARDQSGIPFDWNHLDLGPRPQ